MFLRERKKQETRAALSRVAGDLFAARGFDTTTVDDIAAAVNVSRRTFFRYFDVKGDVVFDGYAERLERFRANARAADGSAFGRIRYALLETANEYAATADEVIAQYRVVQSSPVLIARELELDRGWVQAFEEVLETELGDFEARVFAGAILGVVRAALSEWFDSAGQKDILELGTRALDLLERGVR